MVMDLTAQQPFPNVLRDHFSCHKSGWKEADHVGPVAPHRQGLPMEEGSVDVGLAAHPKEMPGDMVASTHVHLRKVPENVSIDGCGENIKSRGPGSFLIEKFLQLRDDAQTINK